MEGFQKYRVKKTVKRLLKPDMSGDWSSDDINEWGCPSLLQVLSRECIVRDEVSRLH